MSWKIFAGIGVGIGAVALAPFTGGGSIAGAIALGEALTVGGAITGAVVGGVAGAVISDNDDNKVKNAKEQGRQEGKAEASIEISKLKETLTILHRKNGATNDYFETLIAMESIAVATIAYNNINTMTKQEEISDLLRSLSNDTLPKQIKMKIDNIYRKPPEIEDALRLAKKSNLDIETCQYIILLTSELCNTNNDKFLTEWKKLA